MIVFDDIIAYILSNKTLNPIVTELFIRGTKLNIPLVFIKQSYFSALFFKYIIKKYETVTDNLPRRIYLNKTESSVICKIKTGYYLER